VYYPDLDDLWCLSQRLAYLLTEVQDYPKPNRIDGAIAHRFYRPNDVSRIEGLDGRFRIDDTQHTLSAWISYKRCMQGPFAQIECANMYHNAA